MPTQNNIQTPLFVYSEWYPSEMKLLQPPEDLATADWAEKTPIYIVKSSKPGPWRNANNPPLAGIMNAADRKGAFANLSLLVICKGVQTGGSEAIYNILYKRMDGSSQTALLVMENEKKVRKIFKQRLLITIKHTPFLAAQLSENPDDVTASSIRLRSNFFLNAGWSGSQASVASDACETVIIDEVDKFTEAMNIEEAKDRITAYPDTGLVVVNSTPGEDDGPIMTEIEGCDTVMDYHVECPDCGAVQVMDFEHFWWPDKEKAFKSHENRNRHANLIQRDNLARYACSQCGSLWDDAARDKAVRLGARHHFHGWKMRVNIPNPASVGFKLPSWLSPFKSLSKITARWLKAQDPSHLGKLRGWYNQEAAEPFIEGEANIDADALYARREIYAAEVPASVLLLTASVDVQNERLEIEVKGWAPGEESWGILHHIIQGQFIEEKVQAALDDFTLRTFRHESGELMGLKRVTIDSGGKYPSQVYAFCKAREARGVYAIKGSSDTRADILDGKLVRRKDAVFQKVGVTACKDILFSRLALPDPGPGYMHFSMAYDREYFTQFLAERPGKSAKGARLYILQPGKRNEAIDLNNYNLAALKLYAPEWEVLRRAPIGADEKTRIAYRHYRRDRHQDDTARLSTEYPIALCCYFGPSPLVWVLAQSDGSRVWCFDEITLRNASTTDMGMEVLRRYGDHKRGFVVYGSAAGTARGAAGKSEYAILREMGFARQAVKLTNPPEADRVNAVNNILENIAGQSRLRYHPDCIMLRKDFEQVLWLEDMSGLDRTDFGRGNASEALGHYINYLWPVRANQPNPRRRFYK